MQTSDVHSLTVIAKPVAKVDALDVEAAELGGAKERSAHLLGELFEDVLDVSVAEGLALHVSERRGVTGTEGVGAWDG